MVAQLEELPAFIPVLLLGSSPAYDYLSFHPVRVGELLAALSEKGNTEGLVHRLETKSLTTG